MPVSHRDRVASWQSHHPMWYCIQLRITWHWRCDTKPHSRTCKSRAICLDLFGWPIFQVLHWTGVWQSTFSVLIYSQCSPNDAIAKCCNTKDLILNWIYHISAYCRQHAGNTWRITTKLQWRTIWGLLRFSTPIIHTYIRTYIKKNFIRTYIHIYTHTCVHGCMHNIPMNPSTCD